MTSDQRLRARAIAQMAKSLALFGEKCLRVRPKDGGPPIPFVLNQPQQYLHYRAQDQLKRTGKVRLLVLKGRQQGISTFVAARFYHRASLRKGVNVYIMAHEQNASDTLFSIVDRYHKNNPLAPSTGKSNVKELVFDKLDSSYSVATAGQKAGGRGKSITLFHGSEVAFWSNAADHFAASIQAVPDAPGTEIILESTANGVTGEFYNRCMEAMAGEGDYELVFIPWFWSKEYRRPVPSDFVLSTDRNGEDMSEAEYQEAHQVSMEAMVWRRYKIQELRDTRLFKQEYPATAMEAFQQSETNTFISSGPVIRARKTRGIEPLGPLLIGVDPASEGGDKFALIRRRGYVAYGVETRIKVPPLEALHWLKGVIDAEEPARMFIDAGNIGRDIISLIRAEGPRYSNVIESVNFGSTSQAKLASKHLPGPVNRRAEMYYRLREWLSSEEGVMIPDEDLLQAELCSPLQKWRPSGDFLLESKKEMRSRGLRSPDIADALALTFASIRHIPDFKPAPKVIKAGEPDLHVDRVNVDTSHADGGGYGWMG